jgi:very-short-patch-repair endonuclease
MEMPAPITTRDAIAQGLSNGVLRGPRFNTPYRGVHFLARDLELDLGLRCDALALQLPDQAVFSHSTAAALFGIPVSRRHADRELHVTVPPPLTGPRIRGVRGHVRELPRSDVAVLHGRTVTAPARVILDLAEQLPLLDVVVACDAALRQGQLSTGVLLSAVQTASGRRGVVRAREAVRLSNGRARSPMETVLRLTLHIAGLPTPEVNVDLYDDFGRWIACPDLLYRKARLALEYEGEHHRDRKQFDRDVRRDREYAEVGFTVLRVTAHDVLVNPKGLTDTVRNLLRAAGR